MSYLAAIAAQTVEQVSASDWLFTEASSSASLVDGGAGMTLAAAATGWAMAVTATESAMSGKAYVEFTVAWPGKWNTNATSGVVGWEGAVPDGKFVGGTWGDGDCGLSIRADTDAGAGSAVIYQSASSLITSTMAGTHSDGSYRVGVAVDTSTRSLWFRLVGTNPTGWIGGGNPETGSTPTAVLTDTAPLRPAAAVGDTGLSIHLTPVADYVGTVPAGYSVGEVPYVPTPSPVQFTASPPDPVVDVAYSFTFEATGGLPPLTYSSADLPTGATLTSGGVFDNTFTATGAVPTFHVTATDADSPARAVTIPIDLTVVAGGGGSEYAVLFGATAYGIEYSNGNLTIRCYDYGSAHIDPLAMIEASTTPGHYHEIHVDTAEASTAGGVGYGVNDYHGSNPGTAYGYTDSIGWNSLGQIAIGQSYTGGLPTWQAGDTLMIYIKAGSLWVGVNGVWHGDPEAGTGAAFSGLVGVVGPCAGTTGSSVFKWTFNFGATAWAYTPPTGAVGWTV